MKFTEQYEKIMEDAADLYKQKREALSAAQKTEYEKTKDEWGRRIETERDNHNKEKAEELKKQRDTALTNLKKTQEEKMQKLADDFKKSAW